MTDPAGKDYIVVVQCDIAMERCSGFLCEKAFHDRSGGFAIYPTDKPYRTLHLTCGGCCGRALQRKLSDLMRGLAKDGVAKERIAMQLASCVCNESYHGPACPHLDYLKRLIVRVGLETYEGTVISEKSEARRRDGTYRN